MKFRYDDVCPSVTLVGFDDIMHKKWKSKPDRIDR